MLYVVPAEVASETDVELPTAPRVDDEALDEEATDDDAAEDETAEDDAALVELAGTVVVTCVVTCVVIVDPAEVLVIAVVTGLVVAWLEAALEAADDAAVEAAAAVVVVTRVERIELMTLTPSVTRAVDPRCGFSDEERAKAQEANRGSCKRRKQNQFRALATASSQNLMTWHRSLTSEDGLGHGSSVTKSSVVGRDVRGSVFCVTQVFAADDDAQRAREMDDELEGRIEVCGARVRRSYLVKVAIVRGEYGRYRDARESASFLCWCL